MLFECGPHLAHGPNFGHVGLCCQILTSVDEDSSTQSSIAGPSVVSQSNISTELSQICCRAPMSGIPMELTAAQLCHRLWLDFCHETRVCRGFNVAASEKLQVHINAAAVASMQCLYKR